MVGQFSAGEGAEAASDVGRDTGASEENASIAKRERPAG